MNRLPAPLRAAVIASLALLLGPAPAAATEIPDARTCVIEARLVGCPTGDPLPACPANALSEPGFSVRLRDSFNAPIAHVIATLRFTDPAIKLYEDLRPGTTVDCINRALLRLTDSDGWVTYAPRIGGTSTSPTAAEISALTVIVGHVPVTTTDLDGDGLTGLSDLAILGANYGSQSPDRRTDFDGCVDPSGAATTLADVALFARQFGRPAPDGFCQ